LEANMLKLLVLLPAALLFAFLPQDPTAPADQPAAPAAAPADAAPTMTSPVQPTAESQAHAKMLYARDCALCHGDIGNGKNTMDIVVEDWTNPSTLANKPDSDLFNTIRNGKDKMPPEEVGRASDTDVWNLIIYIRGLSKGQPQAPVPAPAPPTN